MSRQTNTEFFFTIGGLDNFVTVMPKMPPFYAPLTVQRGFARALKRMYPSVVIQLHSESIKGGETRRRKLDPLYGSDKFAY